MRSSTASTKWQEICVAKNSHFQIELEKVVRPINSRFADKWVENAIKKSFCASAVLINRCRSKGYRRAPSHHTVTAIASDSTKCRNRPLPWTCDAHDKNSSPRRLIDISNFANASADNDVGIESKRNHISRQRNSTTRKIERKKCIFLFRFVRSFGRPIVHASMTTHTSINCDFYGVH